MPQFVSYAQNGEDVRIWHAFGPRDPQQALAALHYVEVGANQPRHFSVTAALYDLGWRGVLVEPDPDMAAELRRVRPGDVVIEALAAESAGERTFYRIPDTGLSTLDKTEARRAFERGYPVEEVLAQARTLDDMLSESATDVGDFPLAIHAMSIDVEGAEMAVLSGMALVEHRPWVLSVEAVEPGSDRPTHEAWDAHLLECNYRFVAFDGINRWYVAEEHADEPVSPNAGAAPGTTIAQAIATPFHVLDAGQHGWRTAEVADLIERSHRNDVRHAWQRELTLQNAQDRASHRAYEARIRELESALGHVEASRTFWLSRHIGRVGKRAVFTLHSVRRAMPGFLQRKLIRERHLRHVSANMVHLTNPEYLRDLSALAPQWRMQGGESIDEHADFLPVPPGLDLHRFTQSDSDDVQTWLRAYPWDSDEHLDARMDNHDDEVGRARAALRGRMRLADGPTNPHWAGGNRIAIDVRALQSPAFGARGIGRFAKSALLGAREVLDDERITLIVDRGLARLPEDLVGECQQVEAIPERDVAQFSVLIQPSPMTHDPDPLVPLLHSGAHKLAVVYDFIPLRYPNVYLADVAARAEYARNLDALKLYNDYVCISRTTRDELARILGKPRTGPHAMDAIVAWPRSISEAARHTQPALEKDRDAPIVLMTGDEPRKNTFGGLAAIAAATTEREQRRVAVIGLSGQNDRVHHWSIAAAMRPGEATTVGRIDDTELHAILASASCVVVPSFDEGLSLPVIEAVHAGTPVVVSGIASHRELIGRGRFVGDPRKPRSMARAIRRSLGKKSVHRAQRRWLASHTHAPLEAVIGKRILDHVRPAVVAPPSPPTIAGSRLSVGVATPWPPQRTGVADFSAAVFTELAKLAEVAVYTTSDAEVITSDSQRISLAQRSIDEVLADPESVQGRHHAFISVVGNSHFHLPYVESLRRMRTIVIAHDTRMVEYYMALRGQGGVQQLMLTTADPNAPGLISPPLNEQIDDMRLLQNAALWEIVHRAEKVIMHSPSAAPTISSQTGVPIHLLPFANQRVPDTTHLGPDDRQAARRRLGLNAFPEETLHLGTFGFVDPRTKLTDVVVEAAAWLSQWGHTVALHVVGAGDVQLVSALEHRARAAGIAHFQVTGFQDEASYRDWLLAIDIGVQLRVSPLLGVSGPLSDLAAFGTRSVASEGLCIDVDTPAYVHRLADAVSPVTVAEAIESCVRNPMDPVVVEELRCSYLEGKTPERYARLLLDLIAQDQR